MTRHKHLETLLSWLIIGAVVVFIAFVTYSTLNYWAVTAPDEGKLDFSALMQEGDQVMGITVFKGVAAFKFRMESVNLTTGPITSKSYEINVTYSIHRVYFNYGFDVSHVTLNMSMYDAGTDMFIITDEVYNEGFKFYSPPEENVII